MNQDVHVYVPHAHTQFSHDVTPTEPTTCLALTEMAREPARPLQREHPTEEEHPSSERYKPQLRIRDHRQN